MGGWVDPNEVQNKQIAALQAPTPAPAPAPTPVDPNAPVTPGTVSTVPGVLPGTFLTAEQMGAIESKNASNVNNPDVPDAAKAVTVNQTANANELLDQRQIDPSGVQADKNAANINASTVGTTSTAANSSINASTYNASTIDPADLAHATQAVTASLPAGALVSEQLKQLLTPDANGNLPSWVQPAVTAANQFLSGRGISNSTMAGQAITAAILTSAIPIATSNANAELAAWQQNLTNEQQAAMQNGQAQTQSYFTNQAAENAADNFNSTSVNQTNQFVSSLATQVNQFNAAQKNAVAQFNSSQTQSAATNSAQLATQLEQFNATMKSQREQFNTQNAIIVQQSNAEYLRSINTANTAVANQNNQVNAQNAMNLSNQAMANLQQQFNDEATMLYNSNMTVNQQNFSLTYLSQQYALQNELNSNIAQAQQSAENSKALGGLVSNIFGLASSAASDFISSSGSDNISGNM